jgi:hypothetical protein
LDDPVRWIDLPFVGKTGLCVEKIRPSVQEDQILRNGDGRPFHADVPGSEELEYPFIPLPGVILCAAGPLPVENTAVEEVVPSTADAAVADAAGLIHVLDEDVLLCPTERVSLGPPGEEFDVEGTGRIGVGKEIFKAAVADEESGLRLGRFHNVLLVRRKRRMKRRKNLLHC